MKLKETMKENDVNATSKADSPVESKWEAHANLGFTRFNAPIMFGKHVYGFANAGGHVYPLRFTMGNDGKAKDYTDLKDFKTESTKKFYASCVYEGAIYLFFDIQKTDSTYNINYFTSINPDANMWEPAQNPKGRTTGKVGGYKSEGILNATQSMRAVVMNDKIYLFYWRSGLVYFSTFDGEKWSKEKSISSNKQEPFFGVTSVIRNQKACICFVGQETANRQRSVISFINPDDSISYGKLNKPFYWVGNDAPISVSWGSVRGGAQGNMIQIFMNAASNADKPQLRRMEIDLDTNKMSDWINTGIVQFWSTGAECPVVPVAVPVNDKPKDFRHYLVTCSYQSKDLWKARCFNAYASDHFTSNFETPIAVDMEEEKGVWTIVGVIEGVPPFARNGNDNLKNSHIIYGKSSTQSITVSQKHEVAINFSAGISAGVSVSSALDNSFALTNAHSKVVTDKIEYDFSNSEKNEAGKDGFILYSKPQLKNRNYLRLSEDKTAKLGGFSVTWVEKIDLRIKPYDLQNPPEGMRPRSLSTELQKWKDPGFGFYKGISLKHAHQLSLSSHGVHAKMPLTLTEINTTETEGSTKLTMSAGATIKKLFNFGGSSSYKFSMKCNTKSEVSKFIIAKAHLPAPAQGYEGPVVNELVIEPTWLIPDKDARIDPENLPFWIPKSYHQDNNIPWCISWKVITAN